MKKGDSIDTVYESRLPLYKKYADITVCSKDFTLEETVEEIINKL